MNRREKYIVLVFVLIFVLVFVFFIVGKYSDLEIHRKSYSADVKYMISQKMDRIVNNINYLPRDAGNDVLFLSRLSSLRSYLDSGDEEYLDLLRNDFFEFSRENIVYAQLRYIDEDGFEKARVDFSSSDNIDDSDKENYKIMSDVNLQNKYDRYYFLEALNIPEGDVYISKLDLNIENDEIENVGTIEEPVYVPMLRYVTPIFSQSVSNKHDPTGFNDSGNPYEKIFKGVVISNVYAQYFLEEIRRMQRSNEKVFLIDNDGYYLVHQNRSKEFGFMFGLNNSFALDYPEVYAFLAKNPGERIYETENSIIFLRHIYPTLGSFELYQSSEKIFGVDLEDHYHWILIDILSREDSER